MNGAKIIIICQKTNPHKLVFFYYSGIIFNPLCLLNLDSAAFAQSIGRSAGYVVTPIQLTQSN